MQKYFESHAHYDDSRYNKNRDALLQEVSETVGIVVNAGASIKSSRQGIALAAKHDFVYSAVGVHPHDVKGLKTSDIDVLSNLADSPKVVAIGEIGLDYHYDYSPRDIQRDWFIQQLKLARVKDLPVIIHSREAQKETLDIMQEHGRGLNGVVHCFSGSAETAKIYVGMGFMIGITGVVTYKNAKTTVDVVREIPLSSILIETDCPYLSPEPMRGMTNDSKNLQYIARKIADIKWIDEQEVIAQTFENGMKLFTEIKCQTSC